MTGPTPDSLGHLVHVPHRTLMRPGEVTTTLTIDTRALTAAFARAKEQLAVALEPMVTALRTAARGIGQIAQRLTGAANDPVHVAGLEARYYVRAAMDPAYTTPEGLRSLIRAVLDPDSEEAEGLWLVSPANRRLVAVAAMTGWETRGEERLWPVECDRSGTAVEPPLVAHRLWGTTRVEVRCG